MFAVATLVACSDDGPSETVVAARDVVEESQTLQGSSSATRSRSSGSYTAEAADGSYLSVQMDYDASAEVVADVVAAIEGVDGVESVEVYDPREEEGEFEVPVTDPALRHCFGAAFIELSVMIAEPYAEVGAAVAAAVGDRPGVAGMFGAGIAGFDPYEDLDHEICNRLFLQVEVPIDTSEAEMQAVADAAEALEGVASVDFYVEELEYLRAEIDALELAPGQEAIAHCFVQQSLSLHLSLSTADEAVRQNIITNLEALPAVTRVGGHEESEDAYKACEGLQHAELSYVDGLAPAELERLLSMARSSQGFVAIQHRVDYCALYEAEAEGECEEEESPSVSLIFDETNDLAIVDALCGQPGVLGLWSNLGYDEIEEGPYVEPDPYETCQPLTIDVSVRAGASDADFDSLVTWLEA